MASCLFLGIFTRKPGNPGQPSSAEQPGETRRDEDDDARDDLDHAG